MRELIYTRKTNFDSTAGREKEDKKSNLYHCVSLNLSGDLDGCTCAM